MRPSAGIAQLGAAFAPNSRPRARLHLLYLAGSGLRQLVDRLYEHDGIDRLRHRPSRQDHSSDGSPPISSLLTMRSRHCNELRTGANQALYATVWWVGYAIFKTDGWQGLMGQSPGVEGVQLLAHSRGTAILLSALRELAIQSIAAGHQPVDRNVLSSPRAMSQRVQPIGERRGAVHGEGAQRVAPLRFIVSGAMTISRVPRCCHCC